MSQIQKGETFVDGQVVTFDMLNDLVDSAQLLPPCIHGQTEKLQGTIVGTEEVLIYDPVSGALRKAQVQNLIRSGVPIETNYIEGAQYNGQTGTIQILTTEGLTIANTDTSNSNYGIGITSTGGDLNLTATASGYGHGNGKITLSSGLGGVEFVTSGVGKFVFNSSSSIKLPVGTTAQRPATPVAGEIRFNSTTLQTETYNGSDWSSSAIKVAILTRELTSGSIQSNIGFNWDSISYNTISQTTPFVVNAASFTGVPSSTGTSIITLPAGTYTIDAEASVQSNAGSGACTVRVYNNTSSSVIKTGITTYCASYSHGTSIVYSAFTLATQSDIVIQFYMTAGVGAPSTGNGITPATPEVVYIAKITKLA